MRPPGRGVAAALSRLGGLPVDRVLLRLETLPWTLMKGASRAKALRLINVLKKLKVEVVVVPPITESESPLTTESTGRKRMAGDAGYGTGIPPRQFSRVPVESESPGASVHVQQPGVSPEQTWQRTLAPRGEQPPRHLSLNANDYGAAAA